MPCGQEEWGIEEDELPYDTLEDLLEEAYANGDITAQDYNEIAEICFYDYDYKICPKTELITWAKELHNRIIDFEVDLKNSTK